MSRWLICDACGACCCTHNSEFRTVRADENPCPQCAASEPEPDLLDLLGMTA